MLEILLKVLFFFSMLVVYANVTSTSILFVIVAIYVACVFSYYYFDNIQATIDEWFHYLNLNARLNDSINPSHLSAYFANRKFNKIRSGTAMSSTNGKKIFNADVTFVQENNPLEARCSSIIKNGDLPSPIMKNSSSRNNKLSRDGLKPGFSAKSEVVLRRNPIAGYGSFVPKQRYNTNLDLETFMNVNSPGFTSRVVDKATESASYHIKYPAVRQIPAYRFDKSTLRQLSKIPKANSPPAVRIAPPELNNIELLSNDNLVNEPGNENLRSNDYLRVLRDMSRKRNYCQEEIDRSITTPKKSRKNDAKNAVTSQYKRSHEDCSNDSIDDKNCKKRCDDVDRNYAKMMSFTSSMSVLVPEFSWNSSTKKRKSSRLDRSENESPEKIEKCRKIEEEPDEKIDDGECEKQTSKSENDPGKTNKYETASEVKTANDVEDVAQNADETDSYFSNNMSTGDDNEEYVRVASGKILNRTNCTYRKKLNSTKIDPVSVISTEPEYVSDTAYVDDKTMKENLLTNLVNDIERKGEKTDSVIFYQNSIIEEIEKKSTTIEVQKSDSSVLTSSSFNPLLPPTTKPTVGVDQTDASSAASVVPPNQPSCSVTNANNQQQIFNSKNSIVSNTVLNKSAEKNKMASDVCGSNAVLPVTLASQTALQQSFTLPANSGSQSKNSTSAVTAQFSSSATESSKPNPPLFVVSSSSPVFGTVDNIMSAPTVSNVSNKMGSETSPVIATSSSATMFNPFVVQPKPTKTNELPHSSSSSVGLTSTFNATNTPPTSFTTTSSASPFSTSASAFLVPNSAVQNQGTTFSFGAQSVPAFKEGSNANSASPQISNIGVAPSNSVQSSIFGATSSSLSNSAQSNNVFGTANLPLQTNTPPSSIFGAPSQSTSSANPALQPSVPQTSLFGSSNQSGTVPTLATFSSNVTTQTSVAVQPSVFGSGGLSQPQPSSNTQAPQSIFGSSGDVTNNVFGQSQPTAPPVGVVNPLPQTVPQFGCGNTAAPQFGGNNASQRFTFGSVSNQQQQQQQPVSFGALQTPAPATTTAMPSPFGTVSSAVNSGTPQFSFTGPSSLGPVTNSFNTVSNNAAPATSGMFNFNTNNSQPSQPAFQFGNPSSAPTSNQPFMFGGSAAPAAANPGGFSIGTGGGSTRSRPLARPRKVR